MPKHVKILEGHSVKEWEKKYANKITKGKLKVFNKEEDLLEYAKYWKINGKYYQTTTVYEWYAKSLRKSKGLTIALTCTSILATFFLCAALIQSQIQWNEEQGYSISFYAGDGTFSDGSKSKVVNGIKKGTKLKDIKGYKDKIANPTALDADYTFGDWVVDDEKRTEVYSDETPINSTVSLVAVFDFKPKDPVNFKEDTWETVYSVIEQGKDAFIDTYCKDFEGYTPDKSKIEEREKALYNFMDSPTNWKIISVGNVPDYGIRLIGLGQDIQSANDPNPVGDRALATFEFNECIMQLPYSYEQGGSPYYTKSGSGDSVTSEAPTAQFENCALKAYTEDIVQPQLPSYIQRKMKIVTKRTLQIHNGFKYKYEPTLQSWQFNEGCLDGTYEYPAGTKLTENKLEMVTTDETLFSLSLDEIGATKIDFEIDSVVTDGKALMKETTHANKTFIESVLGEGQTGEGFYNGTDYTDEYLFYSDEWTDPDQHTSYPKKRMKKYFIGEGATSVEAQYRLRSIYIPNKWDKDKEEYDPSDPESIKKAVSGNKDYRCFETWNISENGDFGPYKNSPNFGEGIHHFFRGDMAWASIFVAPAFCL